MSTNDQNRPEIDDEAVHTLKTKIVRRTNVDVETADELYDEMRSTIDDRISDDPLAYVESDDEIDHIAIIGAYILFNIVDDDLESAWREFNEEASDADIGVVYQTAFPERTVEIVGESRPELFGP